MIFKKNAKVQGAEEKVEFDERLRFATKVMIQQIILEKTAMLAESIESLDAIKEDSDIMKLFDLSDWYKVLALQAVKPIKPEDLYQFADEDVEQLKKKWNILSIFAEMRSEFIKNYSVRINNSLTSLLKRPVKTAD